LSGLPSADFAFYSRSIEGVFVLGFRLCAEGLIVVR